MEAEARDSGEQLREMAEKVRSTDITLPHPLLRLPRARAARSVLLQVR